MSVDVLPDTLPGEATAYRRRNPGGRSKNGLSIRWRTLEWWGAGACLFIQSGAVFPLMMAGPGGYLDEPAKAKLRLLSLPVYAFVVLMLSRHPRKFIIAAKRNLYLLLLIAMPFLSVVWSVSPGVTMRRSIGLLLSLLLSYILAVCFTPRQLLVLVMAATGACVLLSLALLGVAPHYALEPASGALQGVFVTKNVLGWYSAVLALTSFIALIDPGFGIRRIAAFMLVAALACLAGTTSMTSTIATVSACCLIWFYTTLPRPRGIVRVVFVLLFIQAAAVILILLHEFLVPVLLALGKDATLTGRVPLWELVDRAIGQRLLLGYGYQAFWTEANPLAWGIWAQIQWMAPHAHNGFRDTLLSFGLVGTALLALGIVRALRQGAVLQCRAPQAGWLWPNVFMVMVMVMNLTESIFLVQNDTIFVLFATCMIIFSLYSPVYQSERGHARDTLSKQQQDG
jgi:exopolysaccharide production protein ExoQ